MYVEELTNANEWEDFVKSVPSGTFYYSLKWKQVIQKSFAYDPLYLVVRDARDKMVGVCPGFITKSFGTKIYDSTPLSDYGGPAIEASHLSEASFAIMNFLRNLSNSKGVRYSRFRVTEKSLGTHLKWNLCYTESCIGVMEVDLIKTPPAFIWNTIFSGRRRNLFRKMERKGFQVREAQTRADLRVFYNLYLGNMMRIGRHPLPYSFMESVWNALFPSHVRIWILEGEKPIGSALFFKHSQKTFGAYIGINRAESRAQALRVKVADYITWAEIKKAEEEGFKCVSLGSTPSVPDHKYFVQKSSLGCVFIPQMILRSPLCLSGRILTQLRSPSVNAWKAIRSSLPSRLVRIIEGELDGL